MDSKTTSIVAYITVIGLIVAACCGTKDEKSLKHINQALGLMIVGFGVGLVSGILSVLLGVVGALIAGLFGLAMFACWLIGIITAATESDFSLPVIGDIKIIK